MVLTEEGFGKTGENAGWKIEWLGFGKVSFKGHVLANLRHFTGLGNVGFDPTEVTDADLVDLKGSHLWGLGLHGNKRISNVGMIPIGKMKTLTHLAIEHSDIDDAGLAHLRELTELKALRLGSLLASPAGLDHFAGCKSLSSLRLSATQPMDDFLVKLPSLWPELSSLIANFGEGTLTAKGLKSLANLPKLDSLEFNFTSSCAMQETWNC